MENVGTSIVKGAFIMAVFTLLSCSSTYNSYTEKVKADFVRQPAGEAAVLQPSDLESLPLPVRKYIEFTGAVGKPVPRNFRIEFKAQMFNDPGSSPMELVSEQYNFIADPSRYFFMKGSMFLLPVRVLHSYSEGTASMKVKLAGLVNIADVSGDELSRAETVTLLNDMCCYAPGALADKRIAWDSTGTHSVKATFTNGRHTVSAVLYFDEEYRLVNFTSDDRPALKNGKFLHYRWSTPITGYVGIDGINYPKYAEAVYDYPEGKFTYGKFWLKNVTYNLDSMN